TIPPSTRRPLRLVRALRARSLLAVVAGADVHRLVRMLEAPAAGALPGGLDAQLEGWVGAGVDAGGIERSAHTPLALLLLMVLVGEGQAKVHGIVVARQQGLVAVVVGLALLRLAERGLREMGVDEVGDLAERGGPELACEHLEARRVEAVAALDVSDLVPEHA